MLQETSKRLRFSLHAKPLNCVLMDLQGGTRLMSNLPLLPANPASEAPIILNSSCLMHYRCKAWFTPHLKDALGGDAPSMHYPLRCLLPIKLHAHSRHKFCNKAVPKCICALTI